MRGVVSFVITSFIYGVIIASVLFYTKDIVISVPSIKTTTVSLVENSNPDALKEINSKESIANTNEESIENADDKDIEKIQNEIKESEFPKEVLESKEEFKETQKEPQPPTTDTIPLKPLTPINPAKALLLKDIPKPKVAKRYTKRVKKRTKKIKKSFKKRVSQKRKSRGKRSVKSRARRGGVVSASRFLANLRRRIAKNKSYPLRARRMKKSGVVRVSFTILPSGRVGGISVSGPSIFRSSAKNAVRRAFPINASKAPFRLPKRMSITLRYSIRR